MKNFLRKTVVIICCSAWTCGVLPTASVLAFDGPTHKYTTEQGAQMLLKTMGKECGEFYTEDAIAKLVENCVKPDEDETEGAFKYHFYNAATERNYMGETTSALTKFHSHYKNALDAYRWGDSDKMWEELARSLHFLEDLSTPVHTNYQISTDAVLKFPLHIKFENRCVEIQDFCKATMMPKEYDYYLNNNSINIGKGCAIQSNDNFYLLENEIISLDKVAKVAITNAQKAVSGFLYKFYHKVHC